MTFKRITQPADPAGCGLANHPCDWKPCVRPSHLYEGTQSENERDKQYWGPVTPPKGDVIATLRLFEEEVMSTPITA